MNALAQQLTCACTPGKVFASRSSLRAHFGSARHADFERREEVRELRVRLAQSEARVATLTAELARLGSYLQRPSSRRVSARAKKEVAAAARWRCAVCEEVVSENYEVDHVVPLFLGGSNDRENLQLLCPECHRSKTARDRNESSVSDCATLHT